MPPPRGSFNPLEGPGDYDFTTQVHTTSYPAICPLASEALNKSVFVAGASKGIGLSIALSYAKAGASKIAIAARSSLATQKESLLSAAKAANRAPPQILCISLDVTSQASTVEAASLVEKEFGALDILILNAGVFHPGGPIADSDPDGWWDTWTVNVRGPYLVTRAFLPLMLKGGDKTIVTTSSVGAHVVVQGVSAYQTTKLAVLRLMEFVSVDYKDQGVVAFAIHPGNVATDMVGGSEGVEGLGLAHVFIDSQDLAGDSLVYLTREKRDWLAGRYINCTWDMPELVAMKDEIVKGDKLKVRLVL